MIFTAPEPVTAPSKLPRMFIGGSIENGVAKDWQLEVITKIQEIDEEIVLLNPRRVVWDSTLQQDISNPVFTEQVSWELSAIESADVVLIWLESGTMSPISLLEFGICAGQNSFGMLNRCVIGCSVGFWRKGNIDVTAARYSIPVVETIDDLMKEGLHLLGRNHQRRTQFGKL